MKITFKKLTALLLTLILTLSTVSAVVLAAEITSLSGEGTQAEPFLIGTADELMFAANQSNSDDLETRKKYGGYWSGGPASGVYYKITADIDMTGKDFPGFGRAEIGASNLAGFISGFQGVIYGDGHVISNLTITGTSDNPAGFICKTALTTITDLGLENVTVVAGSSTGAFIGIDYHYSNLQGCYVKNFTNNADDSNGNKKGSLVGSTYFDTKSVTIVNCYSINVGAQGIMDLTNYAAHAQVTNCYTTGTALINPTQMTNYYRNVAEGQYADAVANQFVSGKLTADKLNGQFTSIDEGAIDSAFVADEFGINNGFPVLAWQNRGFVKPGFTADSTTVIEAAADENGYPSFIVYGWLNNFNTSAEGMEYGMKISDGEDLEEYLPARVKVGEGEEVTYVPATPAPNGQFAIRVYVKGLTENATYTMTPYVGTAGNYTYGDVSDGYTVTVD